MTKNKKKFKKSVARRIKVTKTGKVLFAHQNSGHLKTNKRKRNLRRKKKPGQVSQVSSKRIKVMLGK